MPSLILGELGTAQAIFLIGLALLIVILLVRSRRYFRQVTKYQVPRAEASGAPAARPPAHATMPPRDVEQWEVAMHDLARDLSGQLDSKIRVVELLIREAEKVASRLESALARTRSSNMNSAEQNLPDRGARSAPLESANPSAVFNSGAVANGKRTAEGPRTPAASLPSISNAADKPRFDRIYALADAGLSPATIANQIGSQIGEVELILGIRGQAAEGRSRGFDNDASDGNASDGR